MINNNSLLNVIGAMNNFAHKGEECNINTYDFNEFSAHLRVSDCGHTELIVWDKTRDIFRKSRKGYKFTFMPMKDDWAWGIRVEMFNWKIFNYVVLSKCSRIVLNSDTQSFEDHVDQLFAKKIAYFLKKGIRAMLCEMKDQK